MASSASAAPSASVPTVCGHSGVAVDSPLRDRIPEDIAEHCLDPHAELRLLGTDSEPVSEADCATLLGDRCETLGQHALTRLAALRYVARDGGPSFISALYLRFATGEAAYAYHTSLLLGGEHPRRATPERLDVKGQGALRDGHVYVWRGSELFEASFSDPTLTEAQLEDASPEVLRRAGRALAARASGDERLPSSVRRLPEAERVPFGTEYGLRDVLVEGGGGGAIGFYERGAKRYKVYANEVGDDAAARDVERSLRRHPGYHRLKDMPFGAFELTLREATGPAVWLIGRYQDRIVGIGDDGFGLDAGALRADREKQALSRTDKVRLLRKVLSKALH